MTATTHTTTFPTAEQDAAFRLAYLFFHEHAGYATPPGRAMSAFHLAKAEQWAHHLEAEGTLRFRWEHDPFPDLSWLQEGQQVHEVLACVLERQCPRCGQWEVRQTLGGITDPDENYRRVVQGDMALEEMS